MRPGRQRDLLAERHPRARAQRWPAYVKAMLITNTVMFAMSFVIDGLQAVLPLKEVRGLDCGSQQSAISSQLSAGSTDS